MLNLRTNLLRFTQSWRSATLFLALLCACVFSSCRIYGLNDAYQYLSEVDQGDVSYLSQGEKKPNSPVLMLNGKALRERFDDSTYNIVYHFVPHCRTENCLPLSAIKQKVGSNGKVYLVAFYLTPSLVDLGRQEQIYGMDRYFYGIKKVSKMYSQFFNDLTSRLDTDNDTTNLYVFKGKQYIGTTNYKGLDQLIGEKP